MVWVRFKAPIKINGFDIEESSQNRGLPCILAEAEKSKTENNMTLILPAWYWLLWCSTCPPIYTFWTGRSNISPTICYDKNKKHRHLPVPVRHPESRHVTQHRRLLCKSHLDVFRLAVGEARYIEPVFCQEELPPIFGWGEIGYGLGPPKGRNGADGFYHSHRRPNDFAIVSGRRVLLTANAFSLWVMLTASLSFKVLSRRK